MSVFRRVGSGRYADAMNRFWGIGLFAMGIAGAVATWHAWVPCQTDHSSPACYTAMDRPANGGILLALWIAAMLVAAVATFFSRGTATMGAIIALGIVVLANPMTEYGIWLGIAGGHWDTPPGTGYTQSAAFALAGIVVIVAYEISRVQRRARARDAAQLAAARGILASAH